MIQDTNMSDEESSIDSSSNETSSESEEDIIQDIPDKDFFKTLSYLKNKDPRIYDNNVQFFTDPPIVINDKNKNDSSLNDIKTNENEQEVSGSSNASNTCKTKTIKLSNKFSLKDLDNESSSEDELVSLIKQSSDSPKIENEVENEFIQFLKGSKAELNDKQFEQELKPLQNYWNTEVLDENEQFLKDYILNKKYLAADSEVNKNENLSEDERELEEQAEYEAYYNFRFETGNNLQLKRFPRNVEGSMRRKNDARSKKRAEIAQRKKEEKVKKYQDVKTKQKEKLSEIEERLQKIKELTGNVELGFKDEEILEDFDPEKHDQKMRELFNDDYYSKEDYEHPDFNEDEEYWQNDGIEMDCEENVKESKKLTRTQKKKLRKKKTYKDIMDVAKPSFDPKVHNDFKKYIDEYYSLDCEDFIDEIPCKFKYREVVPNDYGLSIEEILMADDSELNRWASVKKCWKRRPEHVEKNEVNVYKKKSQDESLKRTILKSLYNPPEENDQSNTALSNIDKPMKNKLTRKHNETVGETEAQNGLDIAKSQSHDDFIKESDALYWEDGQESQTLKHKAKKKKKRTNDNMISNVGCSNTYNVSENNTSGKNILKTKIKSYYENEEEPFENSSTNSQDEEGMVKKSVENNTQKISTAQKTADETSKNTPNQQRKKRRKKKKKKAMDGETSTNGSNQNKINQEAKNQNETQNLKNITPKKNKSKLGFSDNGNVKIKNKFKNKFGFKKKNSVVNLSDSRLQAYGIKPKQFRAKIIYSQKNKTS